VVGKEVRNILARIPVFFELSEVALDLKSLSLKLCDGLALREGFRHDLPVELIELWFVVECLEMRWSSGHAEKDDALCFGRVVREAGQAGVFFNETFCASELRKEGCGSEGKSSVVEESPTINEVCGVHGDRGLKVKI
jgi:hypothetical protein